MSRRDLAVITQDDDIIDAVYEDEPKGFSQEVSGYRQPPARQSRHNSRRARTHTHTVTTITRDEYEYEESSGESQLSLSDAFFVFLFFALFFGLMFLLGGFSNGS